MADEIVNWLTDVHPVARQLHLVELTFTRHGGKNFSFNRGWSILYPTDDVKVEEVETGIDLVADEDLRLLDEALYLAIFLGNDNAITTWVLYLCYDDGALLSMRPVEINQLRQWVLADDI